MEDKYNKITNKSIKGLILINKRDEHSMLTIKELLDNNIIWFNFNSHVYGIA